MFKTRHSIQNKPLDCKTVFVNAFNSDLPSLLAGCCALQLAAEFIQAPHEMRVLARTIKNIISIWYYIQFASQDMA